MENDISMRHQCSAQLLKLRPHNWLFENEKGFPSLLSSRIHLPLSHVWPDRQKWPVGDPSWPHISERHYVRWSLPSSEVKIPRRHDPADPQNGSGFPRTHGSLRLSPVLLP